MTYPGAPGQPTQHDPYGQQWPQQAQPWQGHPPAPKRRRKWPWIVGGVVLLLLVVGIAGGGGGTSPAPAGGSSGGLSAPAVSSSTATVTYEITGSGRASNITYSSDGSGSISQEAGVKLPWSKEITVDRGFSIVTVSAQNAGSGEIVCRILVDGEVVKEGRSSGQYSVVSCIGDPI